MSDTHSIFHGGPETSADWLRLLQKCIQLEGSLRSWLSKAAQKQRLSASDFLTLWSVQQSPAYSQRQLARLTGISPTQMCGLLESLKKRGLVDSRRCEQDRRRQLWQLTQTGQERVAAVLNELPLPPDGVASHLLAAPVHSQRGAAA